MSIHESLTAASASETFESPSRAEVAKAYLRAEMPNIFIDGAIKESLDRLTDDQLDRLLEGISYAYRINGAFHTITDESLDWMHVELPVGAISLTGTKPHINEIVYSDEIANDPRRFADYLLDYFDEHTEPADDPKGLNEFRQRPEPIDPSVATILTVERNERIDVKDGIHRLVATAMLGATSIRAYAGVPNGLESKHMIGDSTFVTLRLQYENATSDEMREHLLAVTVELCRTSTDGRDAVRTYWIDHPRDEEIKSAGRVILMRASQA